MAYKEGLCQRHVGSSPANSGKATYLAAVEDLFSRRLLGFAMSDRHDAELVVASIRMAAAVRGGTVCGVMHRRPDRLQQVPQLLHLGGRKVLPSAHARVRARSAAAHTSRGSRRVSQDRVAAAAVA